MKHAAATDGRFVESPLIRLDGPAIERALPLVAPGLARYCTLQALLANTNVGRDREFQTSFNAFYRVRRSAAWQAAFYPLLEQSKTRRRPFAEVLTLLHERTGRLEASFASKLVASIEPDLPVIDAFVLKNVGLRITRSGPLGARVARVVAVHDRIQQIFAGYLDSDMGRHLVARFRESYPDRNVTRVKMLDLILWQTR